MKVWIFGFSFGFRGLIHKGWKFWPCLIMVIGLISFIFVGIDRWADLGMRMTQSGRHALRSNLLRQQHQHVLPILMTMLTVNRYQFRSNTSFPVSANQPRQQQQQQQKQQEQHYLYATINNLLSTSSKQLPRLHLILGNMNEEYIRPLEAAPFSNHLVIHRLDPVEQQSWQGLHDKGRATFNYLRALRLLDSQKLEIQSSATVVPDNTSVDHLHHDRHSSNVDNENHLYRGVLVLEDDLIFRDDFETRLHQTIDEIEQQGFTHFAVNCYVVEWSRCYRVQRPSGLHYDRSWGFCCTQCMYFSRDAAKVVSDALSKLLHQRHTSHIGYDILLDDLQSQGKFIIFNMKNPIVQHIGEQSTGLASTPHLHQGRWRIPWQSNRSHYIKFDLNP
jgi:hypothetical protein